MLLEKITKMIDGETDPKRLNTLLFLRLEAEKAMKNGQDPSLALKAISDKYSSVLTTSQPQKRIDMITTELNLIKEILEQ